MAGKRVKLCLDALPIRTKDTTARWRLSQCPSITQRRCLTTETTTSTDSASTILFPPAQQDALAGTANIIRPVLETRPFPVTSTVPAHIQPPTVTTTLYSFPSLEPLQFIEYPSNHLSLPLRRDLLHRAVVFEGDAARQGTAATKYKHEIHGSTRKLRPQKGTGRARLGSRKSPMLRGGGRAFAKKARDFSTGLQRKLYDIAWRTALSYRYSVGQLVLVDSLAVEEGLDLAKSSLRGASWVEQVFPRLGWERRGGGSLLLAAPEKDAEVAERKLGIFRGLEEIRGWGRGMTVDDVDVKDLLMGERVVVEKRALDWMLRRHQSDLTKKVWRSEP